MTRPARLSLLVLLLAPLSAWSNGGPDGWNPPSGLGDGAPDGSVTVRLLREDLRLVVGDDPNRYDVEARYQLSNPGAAVRVRYRVPVAVGTFASAEMGAEGTDLTAAAASVSLELGGKSQGCRVEPAQEGPVPIPFPDGATGEQPVIDGWCVADLDVPAGASQLVLRYRAATNWVDWSTSKSALPSWGTRDLIYPLFPAAGWQGEPELHVTLEAPTWDGMTRVVHPPGATSARGIHTWSWPRADLRALSALLVRIEPGPVLTHRYLVAMNGSTSQFAFTGTARTSTTLGEARYGASLAVDGQAATAWCEGADGLGVGEWIEISARHVPPYRECRMQGIALVPGYAKNATTWTENSHVKAVDIGPCGGGGTPYRAVLESPTRYDTSAQLVEIPYDSENKFLEQMASPKDWKDVCFRVTLREVTPGTRFADTCLSEVAGVVNCG